MAIPYDTLIPPASERIFSCQQGASVALIGMLLAVTGARGGGLITFAIALHNYVRRKSLLRF